LFFCPLVRTDYKDRIKNALPGHHGDSSSTGQHGSSTTGSGLTGSHTGSGSGLTGSSGSGYDSNNTTGTGSGTGSGLASKLGLGGNNNSNDRSGAGGIGGSDSRSSGTGLGSSSGGLTGSDHHHSSTGLGSVLVDSVKQDEATTPIDLVAILEMLDLQAAQVSAQELQVSIQPLKTRAGAILLALALQALDLETAVTLLQPVPHMVFLNVQRMNFDLLPAVLDPDRTASAKVTVDLNLPEGMD
jgi:hypothetical protein